MFFVDIFIHFFTYGSVFLAMWVILENFNEIQGWTFYEVLFLYNLNLFSYGISGFFLWNAMRNLENQIYTGEFDVTLVKPMPVMLHLIYKQINHGFIGHIMLGASVLVICMKQLNIIFSLFNFVYLLLIILGAVMIQSAIMIITGSVSFWVIKSTAIVDTVIYGVRGFVNYPLIVYNRLIQLFLTFVIPYGFINYYPATSLMKKVDNGAFFQQVQYLTPVVGIMLFILSLIVWKCGVNRYHSSGN